MSLPNEGGHVNGSLPPQRKTRDKRLPHGRFVKAPYELTLLEHITGGEQHLSDGAKLTWLAIRSFQDREGSDPCFISYQTLAKLRGKSRETVIRHANELCGAGFMRREHRTNQNGDPTTNHFWAIVPEDVSSALSTLIALRQSRRKTESDGVVPNVSPPSDNHDTPVVSNLSPRRGLIYDTQNQMHCSETDTNESDSIEAHVSLTSTYSGDGTYRESGRSERDDCAPKISESVDSWEKSIESQAATINSDLDRYKKFVEHRLNTWYSQHPDFIASFRSDLFIPEELEFCVGDLLAKQKTTIRKLPRAFETWLINKMKRQFDGGLW